MELRHLRYFTAVAEELHFGRAAARLNISAPTLSHQIGALENMLGAKLFTRRTKSAVALTHSGKRFLIEAHETLRQAAHTEQVGRQAGRGDAGSISIGYILSAACSGLIPSTQAKFKSTHPNVTFQLRRMLTFAQFQSLMDGSIDVGFAHSAQRYPSGLSGVIVDRKPFWLAMPANHVLAAKETITPANLAEESFVAMSVEMETGFWGNIAAVIPPNIAPRIVERAPDAFTVMTLVAAGAGVAVLSESLRHIAIPGLLFRKIEGVSRTADVAMVHRTNESAPVVLALINAMRKQARARPAPTDA